MLSISARAALCLLVPLPMPFCVAMAQQCAPCATHCAMIGAAANANCVKSGIDPVVCGNPHIVLKPLNSLVAPLIPAAPGIDGLGCTSQGICYREGIGANAACMASCFICTPSTVHPDFLLISILYAPPGNASAASFGQSSSSGTTYGIGNNVSQSNGTSVSITESFASEGGAYGGGFSLSLQSGSSLGGGNSDQFSAVTTTTGTDNLKSGKDPLDHTQDIFLLWLNPVVTLTKSDQNTLVAAITSGDAQMSVQAVSASQLMNGIPPEKLAPTQICPTPTSCYTLPGLGSLTQDDINAILAQDPFLSASTNQTPDPSRFIYLQSNPLENTVVAANVTQTFTVSDAQTTSQTTTQTSGSSEGVTTGVSAKVYAVGISLTQSDSWTWTQTVSHGVSSGQTQQASVTLASTTPSCCGITSDVTCEVSIWEDMIYRTFVFVPQPETCQGPLTVAASHAIEVARGPVQLTQSKRITVPTESSVGPPLRGTVTRSSAALNGATVIITNVEGQVLYRIVTDHSGHYFSGALAPGPINVRVGTKVLHTVIKLGQSARLDVGL